MRIIKPVEYKLSEDPKTIKVELQSPGSYGRRTEWREIANFARQAHLTLYVTKRKCFTWHFPITTWSQMQDDMKYFPLYIGAENQEYYFYGYEGRFFVSEIELSLDDIPILISREQETKKEKLQKEIGRIKAMAEAESGARTAIPDDVQILVWNRDGGKCVKCGSQELLEFDHIIPFSKGGSNSARNIQLLCQACNRTKLDKIGG